MDTIETWKDIDGFPGYQCSSSGKIRSFRDYHGAITSNHRLLKPRINKDGYYELSLYTIDRKKISKRVHRVIADTFLGKNPGLVVNHINGNKLDNRIENLEFVTAAQNSTLASMDGLYKTKSIKIVETGDVFDSVKDCATYIGSHPCDISHTISGDMKSLKGFHFEHVTPDDNTRRKPFLYDYQMAAVNKMKDGCVLNGGVGSGKSRTGLFYYFKENGGWIDENGYRHMQHPRDLYIITTARKRDTLEWQGELTPYLLSDNPDINYYKNKVIIDSWNNIKKYSNVYGAFFIFDEQRICGKGVWVKAFLKIAKRNRWILLSATPGDSFMDYVPLFIANGFYRNKTEFVEEHVVYSRFSKYPKVDRYINTGRLLRQRNDILVDMDFKRPTVAHHIDVYAPYNTDACKDVMKNRWDPYKNQPIENAANMCYILRKIVNSDDGRIEKLIELLNKHEKVIIFYNFDYELELLKKVANDQKIEVAEWNGHSHQPVPTSNKWIYLVQYTAGAEGWNCITTDTIIFYSQNYSYKIMHQSAGRIDRLNTPYKDLYYYHLKSRASIDLAISRALKNKEQFNVNRFICW